MKNNTYGELLKSLWFILMFCSCHMLTWMWVCVNFLFQFWYVQSDPQALQSVFLVNFRVTLQSN